MVMALFTKKDFFGTLPNSCVPLSQETRAALSVFPGPRGKCCEIPLYHLSENSGLVRCTRKACIDVPFPPRKRHLLGRKAVMINGACPIAIRFPEN